MISEKDLNEAIAECVGKRNPTASTCMKLAAFLTIKNELYGSRQEEQDKEAPESKTPVLPYSYAYSDEKTLGLYGNSEFAKTINGRSADEIMPVMDELMDALKVVNPRLYEGTMRRIL